MSSRLPTNLLLLILSGLLVVFCFALRSAATAWIGLGVGCAAVMIALTGFAWPFRGAGQRALDVGVFGVGVWLIISARVFALSTARWLCFADAVALAALAGSGLLLVQVAFGRELAQVRATPVAPHGNGFASGVQPLRRAGAGR